MKEKSMSMANHQEREKRLERIKNKINSDSMVQVFENLEFGKVRTVIKDGEPWFVAKDVSKILGYQKLDAMYRILEEDEQVNVNPQGFPQNDGSILEENKNVFILKLINESGLYNAVFNSTLPEAKKFKKWVVGEVLPTLRKTFDALKYIEFKGSIDGMVYAKNGVATTTSLNIANIFKRSHREILRAIDSKLKCNNVKLVQFCTDHITEIEYIDSQNKLQRQYELDESGFAFIALGFTGEQADAFKVDYINAFNKMKVAIENMFKARVIESVLPQDNRNRQFIYVIKNPLNETIKIGVAQDTEKRIKQLQTGAGIELELVYQSLICSNAFNIEKDVHEKFKQYRTFGEWFKVNPEMVINFLEQQTFILKSDFAKYINIVKKI